MQPNRRYYEAQVLVVPLGDGALSTLEAMLDHGVTGVTVLDDPGIARESTDRADVLVFIVASLRSYPGPLVEATAELGRGAGNLVAALAVGLDDPNHEDEREAMRHLRDAVDVLVSVRSPVLAASFLDVLRGGERSAA